jgi:hypothetical protein
LTESIAASGKSRAGLAALPLRAALVCVLLGTGAGAGCAPSLATLQPAHVAPKGHLQVAAAMELGVPTGTVARVVDTGRSLADMDPTEIDSAEQEQLFEAGVTVAASPPAFGPHFALGYTVVDRFELGVRYAGEGWRVGARYQILKRTEAPLDMVLGLGVAHSAKQIPVEDIIPVLKVDDFSRWTVDVPLLVGTSNDWFRVWGGPKVVLSRFDVAMRLELGAAAPKLATFEGKGLYVGGVGGVALGYRHVFVALELALMWLSGSATMTATDLMIAGRSVGIDGVVVYPSFGLLGEF